MLINLLFACSERKNIPGGKLDRAGNGYPVDQAGKNLSDTTAYLYDRFILRKERYMKQNFSKLYNDINLPVNHYSYSTNLKNKLYCNGISIYYTHDRRDMNNPPTVLAIAFASKILLADVLALQKKNDGWTKEEVDFFKDKIVQDIALSK